MAMASAGVASRISISKKIRGAGAPRLLPCRVIAVRPHRTAVAAALGIALLAGACASPAKPAGEAAVTPAPPGAVTPAVAPAADTTTATATTPPPRWFLPVGAGDVRHRRRSRRPLCLPPAFLR